MSETLLALVILSILYAAGLVGSYLDRRAREKERMQLVKMIAAKNYPEYATIERSADTEKGDKKNLIQEQRKKTYELQRKILSGNKDE